MLIPTPQVSVGRRATSPPPPPSPPRPDPRGRPDLEQLRPLLEAAAALALDDRDGWQRLRDSARAVMAVLVVTGRLPEHLTVGTDDPPVLVARTLAAAWRHARRGWPDLGAGGT